MTTKKYIIYYNESNNFIGFREHHFDWEEGDDIVCDGIRCTIFAIFEGTEKNLHVASEMIKTIDRYMPRYSYGVARGRAAHNVDNLVDAMEEGRLNFVQTRKRTWKNFDAILDFVDEVLNEMD